jgi:hypothetical protein
MKNQKTMSVFASVGAVKIFHSGMEQKRGSEKVASAANPASAVDGSDVELWKSGPSRLFMRLLEKAARHFPVYVTR